MPSKYFQIDGVATFVRHTGPSTLPDQPPVLTQGRTIVCLHGAGGNANLFAGLLDALAPGHSLLAFDQPGHGRSGELDSLGAIDRMASFTGALMDKLGLVDPILVGHDMGAAVALECALQNPGRLGGLGVAGDDHPIDPGHGAVDAHGVSGQRRGVLVTVQRRRRLWAHVHRPCLMASTHLSDSETP